MAHPSPAAPAANERRLRRQSFPPAYDVVVKNASLLPQSLLHEAIGLTVPWSEAPPSRSEAPDNDERWCGRYSKELAEAISFLLRETLRRKGYGTSGSVVVLRSAS